MAGTYDAILDAEQGAAPAASQSPYDSFLDDEVQQNQQRVRSVFEKALAVNPDQAAESKKLANTTGLDPDLVTRNLDEVKRKEQARMLDLARMAQDSPVLARQLLDPGFTNQAHDHLDNLSALEQTFNVVRALPAGAATGMGTLVSGLGVGVDVAARATGLSAVSRAVKELTGADLGVALDVGGSLKFVGGGWKMLGDAIGPAPENKNFATDVAGGIGQLMQQIGVQIATGGTASLVSLFSQGADVMNDKVKGDDSSQALKDTAIIAGASITALTEKYGVDALLNRVPPAIKNSALRWIADKLVAGGIEATQEVSEGVLQDVVRKMLTNSDTEIGAGAGYEASVAGTSAAIVRAALGVRLRGNVEQQRGTEAEQAAEQLKNQFQLASQALLRERNPDEFRTLVQAMADNTDGAPKEVYVDAEVLNQLAPEVLAQLPGVMEQMADALAANDVVSIPVGDVLTVAPGTPLEAMLIEHARIGDVRAMSQFEAKEAGAKAQEFLAQESQRVIAQAVDQQATQESHDRVKQTLLERLNTVGRDRPAVNDTTATLYASLYTTLAGQMGITPEAAFGLYGVNPVGQTGQGAVLNTGMAGEMTVEGYHFSTADRPMLTTATYGTGLKGSARDEILSHPDQRLKERLSFYFDKGDGIRPESGVGGRAHRVQLSGVYDADADPLKLKTGNARDLESKLLDLGYKGYANRMEGTQPGQVIMLGKQTFAPELLGAQSRIDNGQRVAPLAPSAPQWRTQASGDPAMLAAKLERMQAMPAWADYDMRIEGSELQVMKKGGVYEQALSSRLPSAVKAKEDPLADVLNITFDVVLSDTKTLAKNVKALQALPNMRKLTGKGAKDPVKNVEAFIEHVTNNLLWLHDHMPTEMRERARKWYDGGRKTIEAWGKRYGISEMQGAAAIAVLSPQNGWFANVSQAERIADMVFGLRDFAWDDAMTVEATRISSEDGMDPRMQAAVGKTLGELLATPDIAARWARVYDQTYNNRAYRVLTPEGGAANYVQTGAGNDATMMWKSYSTIAKSISVLVDGRAENVHYQIGKEHKVRNFYNNLFGPNSDRGYATIDTHAVAAALLRPLASSDIEVAQAFGGGGSASSNMTGLNGTYPIYLEAYRRAAEARGLLPREMQSITWEAVRGLFEAAKKSGLKKPANAIWERYKAGEIEQDQAQKEILALAGDITPPSWTEVPFNDTPSRTYEGPAQKAIDAKGDAGASATPSAKVMFEVAPDPNDEALTAEWNALDSAERLALSQQVAARIVPQVLKELGTDGDFVMQLGGYLGATNPSMTLRLARPELTLTAAKMLGHALAQDSMMVVTERQTLGADPVGVVTIVLPEGYGETEISALYDKLWELEQDSQKLIGGHTTADGQMSILNYSGLDDAELARLVFEQLGGEFAVDIDTVYSAFPSKEDYGYGNNGQEGTTPTGQSPAQRRPDNLRADATQLLREALDARRAAADGPLEQTANRPLEQGPRGTFNPATFELALNENSNMSTVHHEMGHAYLEIITKIASEPNAPQAIVDQVERFLKWQKVPDLATWQAMTLDQKRPHHEALAENYEHYLLTGKAPSLELQPLFRSLKRYMLNAYKSLKAFFAANPNVEQTLPPEMVQFYDRMLATEEQIAQAEEVAGLLPEEDATAEALEKLTARSLRDLKWTVNARNKEIKELQKQAKDLRKVVEAEVRAEVEAMPVYLAMDARERALQAFAEDPVAVDAGLDSIAAQYEYTSLDHMMREIENAQPKAEVIEGMTDQRMLEEYGDLVDQRAIEEAANEAVHNEARARSLATELKSQAEALNPRVQTGTASNGAKVTVNAIVEAAKQFAANVVARTKLMDLKAKAWQHTAAERRAGKRWLEATAKGDTAEAIRAKQDQVLNNAAAKAALDAGASMRKMLEYVKKFEKESVRKKLPVEYLDQIDQLLEAIDLRVSTTGKEIGRRKSLAQWVAAQQALGLDPILPARLLENMALTSFKEMTVDEFTDLTETIKNIEHLGRLKSKLLAAKDKREFDIIAEEIAQSIIANGGKALPTRLEPDGRISQFFKGAWADHRKLNSLVHQMDGGVDNGPFYRAFVRSMNEAGAAENVMLEKATEALAEIYAPIEALPGGISGGKLFIPEIRNSLSRAGRLSVALNWGNEQNRQRVMDGDAWTEAQVGAILKTLSPVELQFVNDVWAHIDGYWPEVKAKQLRVSGVVEDKVEAVPFEAVAADGTVVQMRGGYYPIKYDGDRSIKADLNEAKERASEIMRGAVARPTTRRGHTQARVDEVVGRPVKKDLSVITQHVNQVIHDLAWHEWFIDANRLLNDSRIQGAIRDHYGPEIARTMMDDTNAIAVGDANRQGQVDKLLLAMRSNVTRSIMGASLTTALLQPFGLTQSMARIGVMPVLRGAGRWAGDAMHMENTVAWINGKSEFMRLRSKTFNRELREISQRVQGKSKIARVVDTSLFMLMQKMQMVADVPTWVGQYEKALAGGVDEDTAIALADEAVLASQGGGTTKDLAAVQRNNPFLTQFYSYFSTTLQLVAEKTALTDFKNPRAVAGWLGDMALLTVIPAILPALLTHALKGGGEDDEPEDWAKRLAKWQASYLLGMFVGLRELPTLWSPFDYGGPPAAKVLNDAKRLVQQAGQGEIDDPAVIATIGFMGTALGLPTTQLLRSYKGWKAWDEGDAPVTSILFGPPPKD